MTILPCNVLVLGVGGNVSQGILKALSLANWPGRVIGACIDPRAAGLFTVDRAYLCPRADDPSFVDWVIHTCRAEDVRAVVSGVEPVLARLAANAELIRHQTGAVCIVATSSCLGVGDDKLITCQWLKQQGLAYPRFAAADDRGALVELASVCGYPLIAKPRVGKGMAGVLKIYDAAELHGIAGRPNYVVQEYLGDDASEFTAGCFSDRDGNVRGAIVMRRSLLQGTTYRAEAGEFPEVRAEACRIAAALKPMGPCNVQLRWSPGGPVCFEINVRFSGTTPIRARLGFNEVEAALRHYVLGEPARDLARVTSGMALRYWNEIYIDPAAATVLGETGRLDAPSRFAAKIEEYGMHRCEC